jgi:hypothetical protein
MILGLGFDIGGNAWKVDELEDEKTLNGGV